VSFVPQPFEDQYLQDNRGSLLARAQADQIYSRGNWAQVATILSQWGDAAPTLPPGNAVAFAHAGVTPDSALGQQIISTVVPQQAVATPADPVAHGGHGAYGDPTNLAFSQPPPAVPAQHQGGGFFSQALHDVGGAISSGVSAVQGGVQTIQRDVTQPINRAIAGGESAATGNQVPAQQAEASFAIDPKAATRIAGAAANTGLQLIQAVPKQEVADIAYLRGHPEGMDVSLPWGGTMHMGGAGQTLRETPQQLQLYQALKGNSLGQGILPGGPAAALATEAQQRAANINGHALTFGRGLASAVVAPGSRPYSIVSGLTDFAVAQELDPAAALLKEYSTSSELGRTFTATPEEAFTNTADHLISHANTSDQMTALRSWTGATADAQPDLRQAIVDRLHVSPDLSDLTLGENRITTPSAVLKSMGMNSLGARTFMRRQVDQPHALSWLNSNAGENFAQKIADTPSFTDVWHATNKQVPVNLVSAMARATTPEDVKFMLAGELGTTVDKTPGFGWLRPLEDVRMLHSLPDAIDLTDRSQAVEQVERTLIAANVPRAKWDAALQPVADAVDSVDLENALTGKVAPIVADHLVNKYGVSQTHATQLTRFFDTQAKTDRMFAIDQVGDAPHLPGVTLDGESVPIVGPHQTNELLNRVVPNLDGRDLTQATTRWRAALHIWDNQGRVGGGLEGFSHFLDFITHTWKASVLLAPRIVTRYLADEQLGLAADGLDSIFNHPIRYLAAVIAKDHHIPFSENGTFHFPGTGTLRQTDLQGQDWLDQVHDNSSAISEAMGQHITLSNDPPGKILLKHYTAYPKDSPMYRDSWAGEISQLATNPVTRELARAVRDPNNYAPAGMRAEEAAREVTDATAYARVAEGDLRLFRGENPNEPLGGGATQGQNWTHSYDFAKRFAGPDGKVLAQDVPLDEAYKWGIPEEKMGVEHTVAEMKATQVGAHVGDNPPIHSYAVRPPSEEAPHGLDAVKQAFWDGSLQNERKTLARANLEWGSANLANDRAWSDAYVESEMQRLMTKTSGAAEGKAAHPSLIDSVADGTPFRTPGKIDAGFKRSLDKLQADYGPDWVKGRVAAPAGRVAGWDRTVEKMFSSLMGTPTTTLTRSPAFRQAYFNKAQDLLPFMREDAQTAALDNASKAGVALKAVGTSGDLALSDADAILKAHALAQVKKLIYYPGERIGVTDRLRNVMPFADAWRRVLARWGSLAQQNPSIIRRAQQGVTELQSSGVFHPDPSQGGKEVFTIVPGGIMKALGGAPFPMVGDVSGLNIASQGLPGIGPAVQLGTAPLFAAVHSTAISGLRDKLFPYGLPDTGGGIVETMFPGWMDKLRSAGLLAHVPFVGEQPSAQEQMTVANLAKNIFSYNASSGSVNMHNLDSVAAGWKQATHEATVMYGWMGLAQFVTPSAPHLDPTVKLKNGSSIETYLLAQDYQKMLQASNGDSDKATTQFITKYGPERIFSIEPKAQRLIYGIDTGPEAQAWARAHSDFASKFPQVYGYWAPVTAPGSKGSYQDYLDGFKSGIYAPLSVADWTKLAEARVGNTAYNQARKMVGASPTADQQTWLDNVKAQLTAQYPGFGIDVGTSKLNTAQKIAQVQTAVTNKDVPAGDLTTAAKAYLEARNQALAEAQSRGYKTLNGKNAADLRSWLYGVGTKIATRYPDFTNMWNYVFQYEVNPSG